jgi:hypothetical protein
MSGPADMKRSEFVVAIMKFVRHLLPFKHLLAGCVVSLLIACAPSVSNTRKADGYQSKIADLYIAQLPTKLEHRPSAPVAGQSATSRSVSAVTAYVPTRLPAAFNAAGLPAKYLAGSDINNLLQQMPIYGHLLALRVTQAQAVCNYVSNCQATVYLEAQLFEKRSTNLLWTAQMSVPEPTAQVRINEETIDKLAQEILAALRKDALIK